MPGTPRYRGTTTSRGYGAAHQGARESWRPRVEAGTVVCWRCDELIQPGQLWDLGHDDDDRGQYQGPEHRSCNRGAGARKTNAIRRRRNAPLITSRQW